MTRRGPQVVKEKRTVGSRSLSIVSPTWRWHLLNQVPTRELPWSMYFQLEIESMLCSLMVQGTSFWSRSNLFSPPVISLRLLKQQNTGCCGASSEKGPHRKSDALSPPR